MEENTNNNIDKIEEVSYKEAEKRIGYKYARKTPYAFGENSYMVKVEIMQELTPEECSDTEFDIENFKPKVLETFCYRQF